MTHVQSEWEMTRNVSQSQQKGQSTTKRQALVQLNGGRTEHSVLQRFFVAPLKQTFKGALGSNRKGHNVKLQNVSSTIPTTHATSIPTSDGIPTAALLQIFKHLDFKEHLKLRLVCHHWHNCSAKLNMDPVDEISQQFDVMQVTEYSQEILVNCLQREAELWSPIAAARIQTAFAQQREVTMEMRRVLVDWLIEVHFKFRLKPQTLYTAIGLVNRMLTARQVARRDLQTIGVAAIMTAAKFEERFAPAMNDLVYITSHSSNKPKIVGMEREILKTLDYELALPSAWNYISRFAKVMGLSRDETLMATYFVDLALPEHTFAHIRPSLIVLGSMYLLKQLNQQEPWSDKLAFYTKYTHKEAADMATALLEVARRTKSTSVPKKYKTSTYGAVTPAIQELLASTASETIQM